MKSPSRLARQIANTFGALGYLSCVVQWMIVFAVLVLPVMESDGFRQLFIPSPPTTPAPDGGVDLPPILQQVLLVAAVIFSVGVIVYALMAIPRAVGKAGRTVTRKTAKIAAAQVARVQHTPLTKKQQKTLAERLTWGVKLLVVVAPPLLLLMPAAPRFDVSHEHIVIAGAFTACVSLLWFGIQYIVARLGKLDARDVW